MYDKKIPLNAQEKIQLFDCLYENRQFIPALEIAKEQLQGAKTPNEKEDWLYRLAWSEYSVQDYPKAILASRDAVKMLSKEKYNDGLWVLFMALEQEGSREEAFELLPILEEKLKDVVKMIEIYGLNLYVRTGVSNQAICLIYSLSKPLPKEILYFRLDLNKLRQFVRGLIPILLHK